jgi:hypothetical protein
MEGQVPVVTRSQVAAAQVVFVAGVILQTVPCGHCPPQLVGGAWQKVVANLKCPSVSQDAVPLSIRQASVGPHLQEDRSINVPAAKAPVNHASMSFILGRWSDLGAL